MLNSVSIMGRLVAAPELKTTPSGHSVTQFTLAVGRTYVKQGEERQTDFIDCVAWRNTAEFICRNFTKGSLVAVTGAIQTKAYTDKNGNKRKSTEILADAAYFTGDARKAVMQNNVMTVTDEDFTQLPDDEDLPF